MCVFFSPTTQDALVFLLVATEYISGLGPRLRVIVAVPEVVSGLTDVFYGPEPTA